MRSDVIEKTVKETIAAARKSAIERRRRVRNHQAAFDSESLIKQGIGDCIEHGKNTGVNAMSALDLAANIAANSETITEDTNHITVSIVKSTVFDKSLVFLFSSHSFCCAFSLCCKQHFPEKAKSSACNTTDVALADEEGSTPFSIRSRSPILTTVYFLEQASSKSQTCELRRPLGYKQQFDMLKQKMLSNSMGEWAERPSTSRGTGIGEHFDPEKLQVAQRAKAKNQKRKKAQKDAEERTRKTTQFKAMPLPGGRKVKNNIHALTMASRGRDIQLKVPKTPKDLYPAQKVMHWLGAFVQLVETLGTMQIMRGLLVAAIKKGVFSMANNAIKDCSKVQQNELELLKHIQSLKDAKNKANHLMQWKEPARSKNAVQRKDTKPRLKQEIRKLEADLNNKRRSCIEINSLLSSQTYTTHTSRGLTTLHVGPFSYKTEHPSSRKKKPTINGSDEAPLPMFERQEIWLDAKEQQLEKIRSQKQACVILETAKLPTNTTNKGSWAEAKESHKKSMRFQALKDQERKARFEDRMKKAREKRQQELSILKQDALLQSRNAIRDSMPSRKDQVRAASKLSQPKKVRTPPAIKSEVPYADAGETEKKVQWRVPPPRLKLDPSNRHEKLAPKANPRQGTQMRFLAYGEPSKGKSSVLSNMDDIEFERYLKQNTVGF
jgi:hypothetical protein